MGLLKQALPPFLYTSFKKILKTLYPPRKIEIDTQNRFRGKVFCVGFNKTGTTSFEQVLKSFGYRLGFQQVAEMLLEDWSNRDFARLIRFCHTAEAFQDIPFSLPETFRYLDEAFADAKFILTVRGSKDEWFQSLLNYEIKHYSSDKNRPPDQNDMDNAIYRYRGYMLDMKKIIFDYPAVKLFDYDAYTKLYEKHNRDVVEYFKDRPDKLFVLNVSEPNAYQKLAAFLNISVPDKTRFPWKNKTQKDD